MDKNPYFLENGPKGKDLSTFNIFLIVGMTVLLVSSIVYVYSTEIPINEKTIYYEIIDAELTETGNNEIFIKFNNTGNYSVEILYYQFGYTQYIEVTNISEKYVVNISVITMEKKEISAIKITFLDHNFWEVKDW